MASSRFGTNREQTNKTTDEVSHVVLAKAKLDVVERDEGRIFAPAEFPLSNSPAPYIEKHGILQVMIEA
jgi:hypothetical protein